MKTVDVAALPAVNDPLPPLDDGRIELCIPKDWDLLPRSSECLARARQRPDDDYPQLIVTAGDSLSPQQMSRDNLGEYIGTVRKRLEGEKATLAGEVGGVSIGDFLGVAYVRRSKSGGTKLERLMLETIHGGRLYTIELRAREGTLRHFRQHAEAVAAHLRFPSPSAATTPEPALPENKPGEGP